MTEWRATAQRVLARYAIRVESLEPIAQGLINLTIRVGAADGNVYILQRLNPIFGASVNHNIALVTAHLAARGVLTPLLVKTADQAIEVIDGETRWRVLTYIDGIAHDSLDCAAGAAAAGALLGHFHLALRDCAAALRFERPPVHDFRRHQQHLATVRATSSGHRLATAASVLGERLDRAVQDLPLFTPGASSLVHGDPKISNILFDTDGQALCFVDLDTLAVMPRCYELGDALRSWCNPRTEDAVDACIDLDLLIAAVRGYAGAAGTLFDAAERAALLPATLQIHLELASRFLADVYTENYFGWDNSRYAGRGEHNLARARAQLDAAQSLAARYSEAESRLSSVLDGGA